MIPLTRTNGERTKVIDIDVDSIFNVGDVSMGSAGAGSDGPVDRSNLDDSDEAIADGDSDEEYLTL